MNICPARSNILASDTATMDLLLNKLLNAFIVAPFSGLLTTAGTLSLFPAKASNNITNEPAANTATPIIVLV